MLRAGQRTWHLIKKSAIRKGVHDGKEERAGRTPEKVSAASGISGETETARVNI